MKEPILGTIITDESANRDAIHIAIAPVIAGEHLAPGQDVGFLDDGRVGATKNNIGIIDPFIKSSLVNPDEKVWLFLYPKTITGLSHNWTHPAFENGKAAAVTAKAKKAAEAFFMEKYVNEDYGGSLEDFLKEVDRCVAEGEGDGYVTVQGWDADGMVPDELWDNYEILRGVKVPKNIRAEKSFSCSC
jgi:hypothetical protein